MKTVKEKYYYPKEYVLSRKDAECSFNNDIKTIKPSDNEKFSDLYYSYINGKYKERKNKLTWEIEPNKHLESIINQLNYDGNLPLSYFDTSFLNNLSSLQSTKNYYVIFVEGFAEEYLIDRLKKLNIESIDTSAYASIIKKFRNIDLNINYVIKKMTVDTPVIKDKSNNNFKITLEAILVDLLSDKYFKEIYSSEIDSIYRNALMNYSIKIDRLLRYANKKHIYKEVCTLLNYINFDVTTGEFR